MTTYNVMTSFRIESKAFNAVNEVCKEIGIDRSSWIRDVIRRELEKQEEEEKNGNGATG